jgi:hypothetical protein
MRAFAFVLPYMSTAFTFPQIYSFVMLFGPKLPLDFLYFEYVFSFLEQKVNVKSDLLIFFVKFSGIRFRVVSDVLLTRLLRLVDLEIINRFPLKPAVVKWISFVGVRVVIFDILVPEDPLALGDASTRFFAE